ncbi:splicing factor 3B subunit 2 [Diabrotica undecimpunctata]|uniref:splicing factor 3B subunit 2 n=1 Tax=Diabrotica undecimpunctata TaxID=50387 RepID=UPI003B6422E3
MEELANTDSQSMLADMRDSPPNENMTSESNLNPPGTQEWANDDFDSEDPVTSASDKQLPSLLSLKVIPPEQINIEESSEVILPQALEEVLALKSQRQLELGNEIDATNTENQQNQKSSEKEPLWEKDDNVDAVPDAEVTSDKVRKEKEVKDKYSKNKKKKNKKKNRKLKANEEKEDNKKNGEKEVNLENELENVEIEYVQETIGLHELAPQYRQFYSIFESFKISDHKADIAPPTLALPTSLSSKTVAVAEEVDDMDDLEEKKLEDKSKLSKRKMKKLTRLSVAELKQLVQRPDVVEMHDVTARDPKLLVQLKAHRNTVQVPRHWCFKRKYLQGKRGIEKPPFNLPDFIKKTGIMEMRASLQDKDEAKTLKAKMRERARPKLGKIDIDYQKLHDAFFKWQTKPKMTIHGDLYYEGKEFETRLKEKKPGDLSEELRTALGMPVGPNANKVPPPWLIAMQRYGPPPSYPNLKIPGLNAPIPEGCAFGYHAGGWGKPPVDENGKPLYGDVFGTNSSNMDDIGEDPNIDRSLWGALESESEEESEEEEEEQEKEAPTVDESGLVTPAEGLVTPSGISSIPAGMETPETIELRKKKIESEMEGSETPVLYHIIPEKRNERIGNAMMGNVHTYDMSNIGTVGAPISKRVDREGMVELALDPSELDMDSDAMAVRYEQQMRENQSQLQKEDLSDMLAEHVAKQKSKRKRQQQETKQTKKYKEFKF